MRVLRLTVEDQRKVAQREPIDGLSRIERRRLGRERLVERADSKLERGSNHRLEVVGQLLLQGRLQRQQRAPQVLLAGAARPGGAPQPRDAPREQRRLLDADGRRELEHALREMRLPGRAVGARRRRCADRLKHGQSRRRIAGGARLEHFGGDVAKRVHEAPPRHSVARGACIMEAPVARLFAGVGRSDSRASRAGSSSAARRAARVGR